MLASSTLAPGSILNLLRRSDPTIRFSKGSEILSFAVKLVGDNVFRSVSHSIIDDLPLARKFARLAGSLSWDECLRQVAFFWRSRTETTANFLGPGLLNRINASDCNRMIEVP